jgi:hypothetical protein
LVHLLVPKIVKELENIRYFRDYTHLTATP